MKDNVVEQNEAVLVEKYGHDEDNAGGQNMLPPL